MPGDIIQKVNDVEITTQEDADTVMCEVPSSLFNCCLVGCGWRPVGGRHRCHQRWIVVREDDSNLVKR